MKLQSNLSFIFYLFFSISFALSAQPSGHHKISFRGETIEFPENITDLDWKNFPVSSTLEEGYIGWIYFEKTPSQKIQDTFKSEGLELLEYIPHQAYLFYFPTGVPTHFLLENNVKSIIPISPREKMSAELKSGNYEQWAVDNDNILITLEFFEQVNPETVLMDFKNLPVQIVTSYSEDQTLELSVPQHYIEILASRSYVKWIDLINPPAVPEDNNGRALHRSSNLDTKTLTGRKYTGEGVGVMVRDDGFVGPHIDFQGRITNLTQVQNESHGDGVAGIMAGAGNLVPQYKGMAAGSDIFVVYYNQTFLDSPTKNLINTGQAQITNSSFGQGCNGGYNSVAREVDKQTLNNLHLLHVFSGGNSNSEDCGYGAGRQWGNITGGHKQGKNVLAVANLNADGSLVSSSSRGPATDGRIKPDIAAHGQGQISTNENNTYQTFGGTSGAAPGIAGVSAQLYQAYSEINDGQLPPSGLIKAALLNTANDAGNEGPDFKFGWGIVNGLQAAKLIEDERYFSDSITQGETKTHQISIPDNTVQVRFMVYWTDKEATAGANPSLVNDLDLTVISPSNTTHLPWILNPTPNASTLDAPATTGIDRLNNVEQVLINNPEAGNYSVSIAGYNIPFGPQEYFIVYELIEENLSLTYPIGGEHFQLNQNEIIQWDATNTTEDFILEYSDDNGATWSDIATVPADKTVYQWRVPNTYNGKSKIRVSSGSYQSTSPESFNIARPPSNIQVAAMCPESMTLTWTNIPSADSYDVYLLGEKYMELVGTTTERTIEIPISDPDATYWFAVSAKNETEGWVSERGRAKMYDSGLKECTVGIDDFDLKSNIFLYPNPTSDEVTIDFGTSLIEHANISIVNNLGQILKEFNSDSSSTITIKTSDLNTGIYFVKINWGKSSVTKKLIIH